MDKSIVLKIYNSFSNFSESDLEKWRSWNKDDNPFGQPEFFQSLEESKLLTAQTGWTPLYFCAYQRNELKALTLGFIKSHSYGEYIFDWQWANAYQHYGEEYYPKLTFTSPFSPVSSPKLYGDLDIFEKYLLPSIVQVGHKHDFSSIHFLFTNKEENEVLEHHHFKKRFSLQYHWNNHDYKTFDDYLADLSKNRRKTIKRERREIEESNLTIKEIKGNDIKMEELEFFYQCYLNTIDKKYSYAYLNFEFFANFYRKKPEVFTLLMTYDENEQPIASALFLKSSTTLFGRYWGSIKDVPFLHFELCLYRGIDIAIRDGLNLFEAGAQGEHKYLRGFAPTLIKSAHFIKNPSFRRAINEFIDQEKKQVMCHVNQEHVNCCS